MKFKKLNEEIQQVLNPINEDATFNEILKDFIMSNQNNITPNEDNTSIKINGVGIDRVLFILKQKQEGNYTYAMAEELGAINKSTIHSSIDCSNLGLTSLEGAPEVVEGHFTCDGNRIKNLIGGPKQVKGTYSLEDNFKLESLEGLAEEIGGNLLLSNTPRLKSIETTSNIKGEIKQ